MIAPSFGWLFLGFLAKPIYNIYKPSVEAGGY
jgi:hypothetical protein